VRFNDSGVNKNKIMYIIIIISSSSSCGRVQSEPSNGNILLCVLIMLTKSIWIVIVPSVIAVGFSREAACKKRFNI
jgi:hypothetical protein